jgi:two-component system, cell cycle response regulator
MIDIDRFKQINDSYGHVGGDAVLREAARRIKSAVRRYDAVGRYGGEEFLVVLPGCDGTSAMRQAERIREAIGTEPYRIDARSLGLTCSIGVAFRSSPAVEHAGKMVAEADGALYCAKHEGRNRVRPASEGSFQQSAINLQLTLAESGKAEG